MKRTFYPQMEALRGIAALVVVLFHVLQSVAVPLPHLSDFPSLPFAIFVFGSQTLINGGSAVVVFFVLSGFVMGANLDPTSCLRPRPYAQFIVRRMFRLIPVCIVGVLFAAFMWHTFNGTQYSPSDILENASLVRTDIDLPLWSLQIEALISLGYPILFFALMRVGPATRYALIAWICFSVLLGLSVHTTEYLPAFALGVAIPSLGRALIQELGPQRSAWILLPVFALYSAAPLTATFGLFGYATHLMIWTWGAFYIVAWAMYGENPISEFVLSHPGARWLGRVSFSLYVIHHPIVTVVRHHLAMNVTDNLFAQTLIVAVVAIPLSFVAAQACFSLAEEPFRRLGRWLSSFFESSVAVRMPSSAAAD